MRNSTRLFAIFFAVAVFSIFTIPRLCASDGVFSAGFRVYLVSREFNSDANTTSFVYRIQQNGSTTGISHIDMASFCLSGAVNKAEISSNGEDNSWTSITPAYSDGSAAACSFTDDLIKFSGNGSNTNNYFRLTLNGNYDATTGNAMLKFGNGNPTTGNGYTTTGCSLLQLPVPVKIAKSTRVSACEGSGSSTLTAVAGAASYKWIAPDGTVNSSASNTYSVNNLPSASGTYKVIYTVNNCTQEEIFKVSINAAPDAPGVTGAGRCGAGTLVLSAQTATAGAVIDWYAAETGGATVSSAVTTYTTGLLSATTTYYVQSRNTTTGCLSIGRTAVTATINSIPSAAAESVNVSCKNGSNGSVSLTVSGGTAPFSYAWNTNATTQNINTLPAGAYNVTVTDANGCTATSSATVTEPELLTASAFTASNVSCKNGSNGSVNLTAAGGTAPYTYAWSNASSSQNLSALAAGTYVVTVTDANGCTATSSDTVTEPELLTASAATASNVSCKNGSNGSVNLTAAGGTAPYTYVWSNASTSQNLSALAAGTYAVTVTDANGCTATSSATITEPELLTASAATASNVSCKNGSNGSVNLTAAGGTAPYTYAWSNASTSQNLSALAAGTYAVTVTDANGCTATSSATVTEPELLTASAATASNVSCKNGSNGSVNLTAAGGTAPYTYAWSNASTSQNLSALAAGTYAVKVTDANGCTATSSATVTEPELLTASAATASNVSCKNGSNGSVNLTAAGGTAPYTYAWSNASTSQNLSALAAGTYVVTVTDVNGCTATSSATVTEPELLTASASTASNVSCKNGSNGSVNLTATGGIAPYTYAWSNASTSQNLSALAAGTYAVTVTDANGCTATSSATVTEPALLTATATAAAVTCNGGSNGMVNLSVNGGTPGYSYTWSNNAVTQNLVGISAGTYSVTVTDVNGCSTSASAEVTAPEKITVTASGPGTVCIGSSGDFSAAGGVSYSWTGPNGFVSTLQNPTVVNMQPANAGSYTVVVTDINGCSNTATVSAVVNSCKTNAGIYPTETDCASFNAGKATLLPSVCFTTETTSGKTKVSNVTPGVFFYFTNIVAPASNFSVYVSQTASGALGTSFRLHQGYAFAFANGCTKIATGAEAAVGGDAIINFKNVKPGTVITLVVKYNAKSVEDRMLMGSLPSSSSFVTRLGTSRTAPVIENTTAVVALSNCKSTVVSSGKAKPEGCGNDDKSKKEDARGYNTASQTTEGAAADIVASMPQVIAYPNPFTTRITFIVQPRMSGAARLVLYDVSGKKIAEPFSGNVQAGLKQSVEYAVPVTLKGTIIYQFRMGAKTVQGKLISLQ
jgi:hypothetical protein